MSDDEQDDMHKRAEARKAARAPLIRWMAEQLLEELLNEAKAEQERSSAAAEDPDRKEADADAAQPTPAAGAPGHRALLRVSAEPNLPRRPGESWEAYRLRLLE